MGRPRHLTPVLFGRACVGRNAIGLQIRLQSFRNENASVGLLVILDDRYPGSADSQAATVDRVEEVCLRLAALISDLCSPCLKCAEIRAGRDFLVGILPWKPDF